MGVRVVKPQKNSKRAKTLQRLNLIKMSQKRCGPKVKKGPWKVLHVRPGKSISTLRPTFIDFQALKLGGKVALEMG